VQDLPVGRDKNTRPHLAFRAREIDFGLLDLNFSLVLTKRSVLMTEGSNQKKVDVNN